MTGKASIQITAASAAEIQNLANLLQSTVNTVEYADLVKLLTKVKTQPGIVKTALKFI
ncbi:MAG: hypothetical protein LBU90_07525 [Bacteroidales bacterium]|jgi:hypothetical protein|nr:hypothetical protein [Bacteroidales bacterium]